VDNAGNVGLGHRRLSIIDLTERANQPMHFLSRYSIVFNGEIYNYVELKEMLVKDNYNFNTSSDTEVLMALYDKYQEGCLQFLDGMFAFVIYDDLKKEVFVARDRFGEKPFYYSYEPGKSFVFASEMKALWAAGIEKKVNERMLYNYLTHGYLENPSDLSETFFVNCTSLIHGHYLKLDTRSCTISLFKQYYDIEFQKQDNEISVSDAQEKFRELFYTSVKRRLRSDVPVGSSLSGGLDSSLIVCAIDELKRGTTQVQKTFSARFPGFKKDESRFMDLVSKATNTEAHFVFPSEHGLIENIDTIAYHQEEPFASASIYAQYCVMQEAKANNITVLLDGQGADEYLAGYHSYYSNYFSDLRKNHSTLYKNEMAKYRQLHSDNSINGVMKEDLKYHVRHSLPQLVGPLKNSLAFYRQLKSPFLSSSFFSAQHKNNFNSPLNGKGLNSALHQSILHGGLQVLLRYADRNSMSQSREVRLPFLYHELVEFVFSLPPYMKIHDGWTKWIMRSAFSDLLPEEITWRKDKIGYEPPQKNWVENKIIKDRIQESKRMLYSNNIISKKEYETDIIAASSSEVQNKSWSLWMAGNLFIQ
jgi:asparagine synthase (glutamine-hydrolysing)